MEAARLERAGDAAAQSSPRTRHGPAWGKIIAFAAVLAVLAAVWRYTPLSEYLTYERITEWARALRETPWAPLAFVVAYTPAAFVMFPRPLVTLFGVIAFGPWLGFTYGMTGIILAALATYFAGRAMSPGTVKRLAGEKLDHVTGVLREHGLMAVFAIRIMPAAPFLVEGMIAGAARIKVWHYALGTFLGMLPGVLTTTVFGDQIATALEDTSKINYGVIGGIVVLFAAVTFFVRRWFKRQHPR